MTHKRTNIPFNPLDKWFRGGVVPYNYKCSVCLKSSYSWFTLDLETISIALKDLRFHKHFVGKNTIYFCSMNCAKNWLSMNIRDFLQIRELASGYYKGYARGLLKVYLDIP